nr:hypothetical protein B0A51_12762 [Rachicladosporium sp. CCFEE 5018]
MAAPSSRLPSTRRPAGAGAGRSRPVSMIEPNFGALSAPQDAPTSRSMKRRSLLPQLSRTSSAEHATPGIESVDEDVEDGGGGYQPAVPGDRSPRDSHYADQRAMPPPPTKMARPRPMSMMVPSTAGTQLGRAPSVRTHARTQSKDSNASSTGVSSAAAIARQPAQDTVPKRSSSIRQPASASGLARTSSIRAPQYQIPTRTSSAAISTALKRASTISTSSQSSLPSPLSPRKPPAESHPQSRLQALQPPGKPSFNTYQQHFSPAKSALPKPPLPHHIKPLPAESTKEQDPESARQDLHLLHLSLLHSTSFATTRAYKASAERQLGARHAKLRTALIPLREREAEEAKQENLAALLAWNDDPTELVADLQSLARIHRDVEALLSTRYADLVAQFETWLEDAMAVSEVSHDNGREFVDPLPREWKDAHTSIALQVRALQRGLATLPPAPSVPEDGEEEVVTGLHRLLETCHKLVDKTLKEMEIMRDIEAKVLEGEERRVQSMVGSLRLGDVEKLGGKEEV